MEGPLVSVVMSSYNHAKFVGEAIESVLNQTYSNIEFIIADDGSTDNSVNIIRSYRDSRIQFTAFAQNTAFGTSEYIYARASGKYIATICSDDVWKSTLIETYVDFLESHDEYGCCFCKPQVIDEYGNCIEDNVFIVENGTKEALFRKLYLEGNFFCAPTMCIRRSLYDILKPIRFQYRQLQDYDLWLRLLQKANIYTFSQKLAKYRRHGEGESANMSAVTDTVLVRDFLEKKYILLDVMEYMEDDFFESAFAKDLVLKPGEPGYCVEAEKFGVMLKGAPIVVPVEASLFYYYHHYNAPQFRESMEHAYHISRKDFWKLTGTDWGGMIKLQKKVDALTEQLQQLQQEMREGE